MPRKAVKKTKKADPEVPEIAAETNAAHEPDEPELNAPSVARLDTEAIPSTPPASPVSSSGEAEAIAEAADTFEQAIEDLPEHTPAALHTETPEWKNAQAEGAVEEVEPESVSEATEEFIPEERPPARLERLQKILSQAGISSRRHAEEMITEGRVQVNGKVVTELGTKADPGRDHIRVDGKLIHGAERLRYFVLNKPRGYVTTVSDPEGRPTVMQFFKKAGERLYPVGRLDYLSEGLLLVTNDGDLANKLTKAATGVEKTYLVKVSGKPTAEELDRLREGVAIDRTRPGEGRVHTAPAVIREARAGDNPWFEVVLTEGRNRELRKMFEEIGHHVEKIRRVGYGPLVLDVEPGRFRELEPEELAKLRLAAEGKWRAPKRIKTREEQPAGRRRFEERGPGQRTDRPKPPQGAEERRGPAAQDKGFRRPGPANFGRTQEGRSQSSDRSRSRFSGPPRESDRPRKDAWRAQGGKPDRRRQEGRHEGFQGQDRGGAAPRYREDRPRFDRPSSVDRPSRFDRPTRFDRPPRPADARSDRGRSASGERTGPRPPRRETGARHGAEPRQDRFGSPRPRPGRPPARSGSGDREERPRPAGPRPPGTRPGTRPGARSETRTGARPERPASEFRGERPRPPRAGGPATGRPNHPSGQGSGRPPFKKSSGRNFGSGKRSNPRGGPRRDRG